MTPTEQKAFDAMREALEEIICAHPVTSTMRQVYAIVAGRNALTAANAVQPQAQGEAWVWNPASTEWEKVRAFGHWHQCAIYAFGSTQPEPLAHPQATEPAGKTRDPLDLGQYVNEANISANDKPVAVIENCKRLSM